jgi:anti-anti-sigma regulatory factor
MVQFEKKRLQDGTLHITMTGKIDEHFDGAVVLTDASSAKKVVLHLAGIRSMTSLGVRRFEDFILELMGHEVVFIHVSPAIATQLVMISGFCSGVRVESAKLPFVCAACGAEKNHSVPWRPGVAIDTAPKCSCGATMELDGMAKQYLPS